MTDNKLSNLEETVEWMDEQIEHSIQQDKAIIRLAGWKVVPYEFPIGADIRRAFAVHEVSGQIIEIELEAADESTNMWSEALEVLITKKSTVQERWDNSDLKKDLGL
jgi:hypothetical protein